MNPTLKSLGYFTSPLGGADIPYTIPENHLMFELITTGAVFDRPGGTICTTGWIFVHQQGEKTVWLSPPGRHYECITALFTCPPSPRPSVWPRSFLWTSYREFKSFCHEMLYAFHQTDIDRDILGDLILSQLRFSLEQFQASSTDKGIPRRIRRVMSFMDEHYADDLSINDLADVVNLSASHLHARFKEFVDMTPHQYLISRRMRAARHQLVTTADPIKAIAHQVGYSNTENFCRAFKHHFQSTAAAYRKKYTIYQ